jgi:hypothetical protein
MSRSGLDNFRIVFWVVITSPAGRRPLRVGDFIALALAFVAVAAKFGDGGMALFVPAALIYLLAAAFGRRLRQAMWVKRAACVIAQEQARASKQSDSQ